MRNKNKIGIIVRYDTTGLSNQTRNIAKLLDVDKIIAIDFSSVNKNEQYPELLDGLTNNRIYINGWITEADFDNVLSDIDVLITCEIDYSFNYSLTAYAKQKGVKVVLVANFEFCDWLQNPKLPMPDIIANHSEWRNNELEHRFGKVPVLETPIFIDDYNEIALHNINRRLDNRRFVHIAGRKTYKDRNGTQDLLEAVKLIPQDVRFELVIKTQTAEFDTPDDSRITVDRSEPLDERELYRDFDAMILPRRYGGASLPMTEALASGLPVIMTDIEPNNHVLLPGWLVRSNLVDSFVARTEVPVYSADRAELAKQITKFATTLKDNLVADKLFARQTAIQKYSDIAVKEKWDVLIQRLGV